MKRKRTPGVARLLQAVGSVKRSSTGNTWQILHRVESMLATAAGRKPAHSNPKSAQKTPAARRPRTKKPDTE